MSSALRWVWDEPRVPHPPARVWRDWWVVAALLVVALAEQALRAEMVWRPVAVAEVVILAVALMWRRTHPLAMVALGFGTVIAVDVVSIAAEAGAQVSPDSMAFLLLLPYALFRWDSGRNALMGLGIAVVAAFVGLIRDASSLADSAIGLVILMLPAVLGATVRLWTASREREIDQVRLLEREQLARELHDTVAHHVSAMVIRAQAGRVVAAADPDAAVEALEIIEAEGSRTLLEMRSMVGALREGDEASLAPQAGIADLERLAHSTTGEPAVTVHVSTDALDASPAVGAAVYRIAQESLTNAMRHARNVHTVVIDVTADGDSIRVHVSDDGQAVPSVGSGGGFGIVGMTERATLLGGSLNAGPAVDGGWIVDAVLPRSGANA